MKNIIAALFIALFSLIAVRPSGAGQETAMDIVQKNPAFGKFMSAVQGKATEARDIGNLYEVIYEQKGKKNIVYVTKDSRFLVFGALIDRTGKNITKERIDDLTRINFSDIPLQDSITIKKGTGEHKLVMVTDVDCPYCRKAYEWLQGQDNYTLHVFLFPLDFHPQSYEKSVKVLCAKDPVAALNRAKSDEPMKGEKCNAGEDKLKKHILVGQMLNLSGTPLFVLENGRKVEGLNKPELEKYLGRKGLTGGKE